MNLYAVEIIGETEHFETLIDADTEAEARELAACHWPNHSVGYIHREE